MMLINVDKGNLFFMRNFNLYFINICMVLWWIYELLIFINLFDGEQKFWLVFEWEQLDVCMIEMMICDGVQWSDGEDLMLEDVVFIFQLFKDNFFFDIKGVWQYFDSVEIEGDDVIFYFKIEDVFLLLIFGQIMIVLEYFWVDVKDFGMYCNEKLVGIGFFVFGNYNDQQYLMDKNFDYWQVDLIEIEYIIFLVINLQLDIVMCGYDWVYLFIFDVEGIWGVVSLYNIWWFLLGGVIVLMLNFEVVFFDDVNVCCGIVFVFDCDEIVEIVFEGYMKLVGQIGFILFNQEQYFDFSIFDQGLIMQDEDVVFVVFVEVGYMFDGD